MSGLLLACTAALTPTPVIAQYGSPAYRIHAPGIADHTVATIKADLASAEQLIGEVLGEFRDTVVVRLLPTRAAFSAALREAWGMADTECWMVGAADDHALYLLSPGAWGSEEVCDHDPNDDAHRRMLVAHELVHAFHGQVNASGDLGLLEDLGWFIEGLATYVSGQLAASHAGRAREAVVSGAAPKLLAQAWSGPYRYAVTGSMAHFMDRRWGRAVLREAMTATSQAALLGLLRSTETDFIQQWQQWVREQ